MANAQKGEKEGQVQGSSYKIKSSQEVMQNVGNSRDTITASHGDNGVFTYRGDRFVRHRDVVHLRVLSFPVNDVLIKNVRKRK